jgi:hypothetical protein
MDEQTVRQHAQAQCEALLAGDIGRAAEEMSKELRSNLGPIVAMLPMPMTEATIESVEMTKTGYLAVLRLVGDGGTLHLETRWKDRDGRPTIVEASRVHEEPAAAPADGEPTGDEAQPDEG